MAALVEVGMAKRCLGQQHQNLKPVVLSTQWAGVPMKKNKKMVSPGRKGQWCFEGDLAFLASSGFRVKKPWISSVFVRAASQSSSFSQLVSQAQEPLAGTGARVSRIGSEFRVTKETSVEINIDLDGNGICDCDTGIPFLDHMLDQLAAHGLFDLRVKAKGDTHIDDHHTNEDVALALGTALLRALGDRKGICRFGDFTAPLDEALVHVVLDLSGRPHLSSNLEIPTQRVGNYDTQLVEHFFQSLANTSGMTLHICQLSGENSHHIIEATFKAFARALRQATEHDERRRGGIPSSKGVLSRA
ncbi:unnamed protein product [Sphagnum compactum]